MLKVFNTKRLIHSILGQSLAEGDLSLDLRVSSHLFMNSSVEQYLDLGTSLPSLMQRARSFVIKPFSTVSMTDLSRISQKFSRAPLLSSFALCIRPRVQAKIEAMGLVEVSWPFYHYL